MSGFRRIGEAWPVSSGQAIGDLDGDLRYRSGGGSTCESSATKSERAPRGPPSKGTEGILSGDVSSRGTGGGGDFGKRTGGDGGGLLVNESGIECAEIGDDDIGAILSTGFGAKL